MSNPSEQQRPVIVGVHIDPDGRHLHSQKFRSFEPLGEEMYADSLRRVARLGVGFLLVPYHHSSTQLGRGSEILESETIFVDQLAQNGENTAILHDTLDFPQWKNDARRQIKQALNSWGITLGADTEFVFIGAFFQISVIHAAMAFIDLLAQDSVTNVLIDKSAVLSGVPERPLKPSHGFTLEEEQNYVRVRRATT